ISFLRSLMPVLPSLDAAELFAIMRQNGLLAAAKNDANTNRQLLADLASLTSIAQPEELAGAILAKLEAANEPCGAPDSDDGFLQSEIDLEVTDTVVPPHAEVDELPTLDVAGILRAVDHLKTLCPSADQETVEFFIAKAVGKLWREVLVR